MTLIFVYSTLPTIFLTVFLAENKKCLLVVGSKSLSTSLSGLVVKNKSKIIVEPNNKVLKLLLIFSLILFQKLRMKKILFFHECCSPILDLIIAVLKPQGDFYPQVTMDSYIRIHDHDLPEKRKLKMLKYFKINEMFIFYRSAALEGVMPEYCMSLKQYPKTIVQHRIANRKINRKNEHQIKNKNILFIIGVSYANSENIRYSFQKVLKIAQNNGYICFIKDHPNPRFRLELFDSTSIHIEPLLPAELISNKFQMVIGLQSTALLSFSVPTISIVNLVPDMNIEDRNKIKKHFNSIDAHNNVNFIESELALRQVFHKGTLEPQK